MPTTFLPKKRFDRLLEICNQVREAGGAEPIEDLKPGLRKKPKSCLVANSLNFDCSVVALDEIDDTGRFSGGMIFKDEPADAALCDVIASATGWKRTALVGDTRPAIELPEEVWPEILAFDQGLYPDRYYLPSSELP